MHTLLVGDVYMESKLEEFKAFVKDKPYLAKEVKEGKISWQTLYETYDIFGKEHEFFKMPEEEKESSQETENTQTNDTKTNEDRVSKIIKSLQKIDTKKISDGLDNVKKIVGMIDELRPTGGSGRLPSMRIKPFRRYND